MCWSVCRLLYWRHSHCRWRFETQDWREGRWNRANQPQQGGIGLRVGAFLWLSENPRFSRWREESGRPVERLHTSFDDIDPTIQLARIPGTLNVNPTRAFQPFQAKPRHRSSDPARSRGAECRWNKLFHQAATSKSVRSRNSRKDRAPQARHQPQGRPRRSHSRHWTGGRDIPRQSRWARRPGQDGRVGSRGHYRQGSGGWTGFSPHVRRIKTRLEARGGKISPTLRSAGE